MNQEEYSELYRKALELDEDFEPVYLDFEIEPGEDEGEAQLRCLLSLGILIQVGDAFVVDRAKAKEYDPNLLKILDAMFNSERLAELDRLVEQGEYFTSVDEEGNIIYVHKDN